MFPYALSSSTPKNNNQARKSKAQHLLLRVKALYLMFYAGTVCLLIASMFKSIPNAFERKFARLR
jgi:phage terminase Nu1 subunit (DNA packaging protein)